ncbi:hypothetical protein ACGC1H_003215 [Rhizoctonia solani]
MPNWGFRSGTHYGEFRASELDHDRDHQVDSTQLATLGPSRLPPSTNYGKKFRFCIVDPKQDLAVLVDEQVDPRFARFHLHSVTTGQPHPFAEHPILTVRFDDAFLQEHDLLDGLMSTDPKVMGNYLAVKFNWLESDYNVTEVLLWDWRAGVLLARIHCEHHSARYTYLDKEHLLVYSALAENDARSTHLALLIYHIPNITSGYAVPTNANFCPSLYPKHNPALIFELPELQQHWEITRMDFVLSANPLPGDIVYAKSATLLCSRVTTLGLAFQIRNTPRQQPFVYRSRKGNPTELHVFVSTQPLFTYFSGYQSGELTTRTIPWSEWGTSATRWFIEDYSLEHSTDKIYGSQYIRSTTLKSGEAQLVSIVDFNTPIIRRHAYKSTVKSRAKREAANQSENMVVLEGKGMTTGRLLQTSIASTELPVPIVGEALNQEVLTEMIGSEMKTIIRVGFQDPVVSCLPYRVVTKIQRMPLYGYWQIHGEYLVGIPRRDWWERGEPSLPLYKLKLPYQDQQADSCSTLSTIPR